METGRFQGLVIYEVFSRVIVLTAEALVSHIVKALEIADENE